jgi:hypothetical protein
LEVPLSRFLPRKGQKVVWSKMMYVWWKEEDLARARARPLRSMDTATGTIQSAFDAVGTQACFMGERSLVIIAYVLHRNTDAQLRTICTALSAQGFAVLGGMVTFFSPTQDLWRSFQINGEPYVGTDITLEECEVVVSELRRPGALVNLYITPEGGTITMGRCAQSEHSHLLTALTQWDQVKHFRARKAELARRQSMVFNANTNSIPLALIKLKE